MEIDANILRQQGRQQDPRYSSILNTANSWEAVFTGIPYAGEGENPRHLPQITMHDLKKSYDRGLPVYQDVIPESLFFSFYNDKYFAEPGKAITLPAGHLWWMVSFQDTVLLSDHITHHYTSVAHVDRENQRICFIDPWIKDFFLLKGRNAIRANAVIENEYLVSISKNEFLKSVTGIITVGSPTLIEQYFKAFPESRTNGNILLRFGLCMLDSEEISLASHSANYLMQALSLIEKNDEYNQLNLVISSCYFAITWALFYYLFNKNDEQYQLYKHRLKALIEKYSFERVSSRVSSHDFCRLGLAAASVNEISGANYFFDRALQIDPKHERACWFRAICKTKLGRHADAADDIQRALILNTENIKELENRRNNRPLGDRLGWGQDDGRIVALEEIRKEEVKLANNIWKILVEIDPGNLNSRYKLLALILLESGQI